jgi:hypothetical protein
MAEQPNMLLRDLGDIDRAILINMTQHQGFPILVRMFHEACESATAEAIKLDPMSDNYEKRLVNLQLMARATHRFCASVLKSIEAHKNRVLQDSQQEEEDAELMARIARVKSAVEN